MLVIQLGSSAHPAMPHRAVSFNIPPGCTFRENLRIVLYNLRRLIFGCQDNMRNCQVLSIHILETTGYDVSLYIYFQVDNL